MRELGTDLIDQRSVTAGEGFPRLADTLELRPIGVDRLKLRIGVFADVNDEVGGAGVFAERGRVDELPRTKRITRDVEPS